MSTAIPTVQTTQPPRAGLVIHEIIADGIIHAAATFGIEQDESFVERVAAITWANGARLVQEDVYRGAAMAARLAETLEFGREPARAFCIEVASAVDGSDNAFEAIRNYYRETLHTRELDLSDATGTASIRQRIGEAAVCGIMSRGMAPELFNAVLDRCELCKLEEKFLTYLLADWVKGNGLPRMHPFLQMASHFYAKFPLEGAILIDALGENLITVLREEQPWSLERWLVPGWKAGLVRARFAPDSVAAVFAEAGESGMQETIGIFMKDVFPTQSADGAVNIAAAFERYRCRCGIPPFDDEERFRKNARLVAARAFDFAFWMALLWVMPQAAGGVGGGQ